MRVYIGTSNWQISMNLATEEDETATGAVRYTATLTDGQYRHLYPLLKDSNVVRVRPFRAYNFVDAHIINNQLVWVM